MKSEVMEMRLINADEYMSHLRANINTTADIIAKYIKKDKPIGTVADGGQIGYLNALQWARASLECDCYTVQAIPIPNNATNGDMILTMLDTATVYGIDKENDYITICIDNNFYQKFRYSWWNAQYKRGNEND